jgi:prepilin-type N-terminal cleavage/methylation domain-containing protein/prepilin-type processing-associated H-X9-DG protein
VYFSYPNYEEGYIFYMNAFIHSPRKRVGFTLIELLVVIAIIAILAAILFPVFAQARAKARQITCVSNVKQIAIAQMMYLQDYDETFVPYQSTAVCPWPDVCGTGVVTVTYLYLTQPYSKSNLYAQCPDAKRLTRAPGTPERLWREGRLGYGMAWPIPGGNPATDGAIANPSLASLDAPADHIMVGDAVCDGVNSLQFVYNPFGGYMGHLTSPFAPAEYAVGSTTNPAPWHQRPEGRHNGLVSIAFCDGHAKAMPFDKVYPMKEEVCKSGNGQSCSTTAITATSKPDMWKLWK